jgi:crotonobetainyl-CoA:carnitine CoA-transferase CaiB-like acyl-CoA transferase
MTALSGLKVVDLSHIMAGPTCTLMLADMGATVIKVEKVPGGDDTRRSVPPSLGEDSAAFVMMNRNKESIALNLRSEGGKAALTRLLKDADILVENYRQDTIERLGFGYDAVHAINPRIIYCSISGFGRTGPYAGRGGFDLVAQAMSGVMSITGTSPDDPPVKCGAPMTDITAGILATMGILAAVHHRSRSGVGQLVDTSLLEAGIVHTYWQSAMAFATGVSPGPLGSAHPLNAPYQAFETADGWIVVGGANQRTWERLLEALGAPELGADPRFAQNSDRMQHRAELEEALTPLFRSRTKTEWLDALEAAGVPAGPVNSIKEMQNDPQVIARGMVPKIPHDDLGTVQTIGLPVKFSDTPGEPQKAAPRYGQHSRKILREHGYSDSEITDLINTGAVIETP